MKLKILATVLLLTPLFLAVPSRAENTEHVKRLLTTKECQDCDLSGANLSGADLSFAVLVGANLSGANLTRANLRQADLTRANLSQTNLNQANLNAAYLNNANLEGTSLVGASVTGTKGLPIMNPPIARLSLRTLPPIPAYPVIPPPQRPSNVFTVPLAPSQRLIPVAAPPPLRPVRSTAPLRVAPLATVPTSAVPIPPSTAQAPGPIQPRSENPTTSPQPTNTYPPRLIQGFMEGCTKGRNFEGVNMQSVCSCSINKIQNEYPLDEFMVIVFDMADKKQPPERIVQIATECALTNLSGR